MLKNKWIVRAVAMAAPHLLIAAGLLLISERLLSQYENAAGVGRLAIMPPIDYPFFFYPVAALVAAIVAIRRRSIGVVIGSQAALVLAGLYFANRLREQAESIAVLFVPGWTAAIAHGVAWGSYLFALAAVLVLRPPANSRPDQK